MTKLLKDRYFQPAFFDQLSQSILQVYPEFDAQSFHQLLYNHQWANLELKARMRHASQCLQQTLPIDYTQAIEVLSKVAPQFTDFDGMLFPDFVEVYGQNDWQTSITALELFTQYSSAEFAIRPFIEKYFDQTMTKMREWSTHPNHHVRRLASEGCRPRLPWASPLRMLKKDPAPILPLLENLNTDPTDYVRRSVANNLNDIAKDHPEIVIKTAKSWFGSNKETNWIVKHACRTLLKQGNADVLVIFGFGDATEVQIEQLKLKETSLAIGDNLEFSFTVRASAAAKLRVEYGIDYMKANGKTSRKIFQINESEYAPNEVKTFTRKQSLRNMTTRKHHVGKHHLAIIVNGVEKAKVDFDLA
ncbi:DNA alkylation repair protein [Microscilla marina]|uniref:Heat shock protein n=1 Tax=Microscilla marina ATCC 23134 TaxID=313606 RepID=A1ZRE0_MICM2|nr:DNA alkylation repair protein [Microscilla marina]EAY27030.1 heat shock protein [Microscilla marina ATCC 23134]